MKNVERDHPLYEWLDADKSRTRFALAKKVNVSAGRITQIMAGEMPSGRTALLISQETGIPVETLLSAARTGAA